jgi:hypothetical protein
MALKLIDVLGGLGPVYRRLVKQCEKRLIPLLVAWLKTQPWFKAIPAPLQKILLENAGNILHGVAEVVASVV